MRILYVEDNLTNVSLVKRVARGHTLISYVDGEEALRYFDRDDPDLVLMDVQLAGKMTGLDVVRKLRSDGVKVPIIAVTAYAMLGDRETCLQAGCDDYIAKPLPIPQLVEIIQKREKALQGVRTQPAETTPVKSPDEPGLVIMSKSAEIKRETREAALNKAEARAGQKINEASGKSEQTEEKPKDIPAEPASSIAPDVTASPSIDTPAEEAVKPLEMPEPVSSSKEEILEEKSMEVAVQSNESEAKQ